MRRYKGFSYIYRFDSVRSVHRVHLFGAGDLTIEAPEKSTAVALLKQAVILYLEQCQMEGKAPEIPKLEHLAVSIYEPLASRVRAAAAEARTSISDWIVWAMMEELARGD